VANSFYHAVSSVKRWGGKSEDYTRIHAWFDESKRHFADFRHRALRHHTEGIFMCEQIFGTTITNSDGRIVPVRAIGEQHVMEDFGRIPSLVDWLVCIKAEPWMQKGAQKLSVELADDCYEKGENS
jgi:hypothetical protein